MDSVAIFQKFETRREGLYEAEASERLVEFGPNVFAKDQRAGIGVLIWHAVFLPCFCLLSFVFRFAEKHRELLKDIID